MKNLLVAIAIVTLCALIFSSGVSTKARSGKSNGNSAEPAEQFVPGRVLVKFHENIGRDHARQIIAALGARDADEIPNIGVHILDLPYQANEHAFVNAFRGRAEVDFAELDRIVEPAGMVPNDPAYANWQWHLQKISGPDAWSISTGNSGVVIAILDTGVEGSHPDLMNNLVSGWNIYDNNSNTADVNGHGTNVAGVTAAETNNGIGVAAVCWHCKIMPIRISDTAGNATYSAMASGLNWAANHGARVANLSFIASNSSTVKSAAQYFQSKGGVVTSAAGNYSTFDSSSDNAFVLTISATDVNDAPSSFSNYGNNVDLSAPEGGYTTAKGGGYAYAGGTSFASPVVAGLAALVMSANPGLSGSQVQDILKQSADDFGPAGWDIHYGWGRVNASRALALAGGSPQPPPTPTPSPTPTPTPTPSPTPTPTPAPDLTKPIVTITSPSDGSKAAANESISVSASDNIGVVKNDLYVDGVLVSSSTSAPFTNKWNSRKASTGAHTLFCKAYDAAGNVGSSQTITLYK